MFLIRNKILIHRKVHVYYFLTQFKQLLQGGTSRQRSGKGAIRKKLPLQKPRWEKTKLTIRYLYSENIS